MKFIENRPEGSGDIERTQFMDGLTEEGHSYKPHSALWRGINNAKSINAKVMVLLHCTLSILDSFLKKRKQQMTNLATCNELCRLVTVSNVIFFLVKLIFYYL